MGVSNISVTKRSLNRMQINAAKDSLLEWNTSEAGPICNRKIDSSFVLDKE